MTAKIIELSAWRAAHPERRVVCRVEIDPLWWWRVWLRVWWPGDGR